MSAQSTRLIIFAKAPHLGRVKTRLSASGELSPTQARAIYIASLKEVWRRQASHRPSDLYVTAHHPYWLSLGLREDQLRVQQGPDLGERMYNALSEALKKEVCAALILGTDSPQLSPLDVEQAFESLLSAQADGRGLVTFGPALDGGYVWVGLNRAALASAEILFKDMVWSTREVLQVSLTRAQAVGLDVHLGAMSWDLDGPEDLERLFRERALTSPSQRVSLGGGFDAYELAPPRAPELRAQYHDALERLFALTRFGERMDLETPRRLNRALGDPLSAYQSVLIGGTNGKGSTTAYLTSLAEQAGLVTGRFSSPHLISFRERITLSGRPVPYELVIEGVERVFEVAEREGLTMSFFEATWALAAWCFERMKAEWVIWEVGLGGRLDATNVCDPVVSAITSIGLDHVQLLGDRLELIAAEKAHISRPGRPALTGATGEGLVALTSVAPQFLPAPSLSPEEHRAMDGRLHPSNAALALAVADASGWELSQAGRLEALRRFEWPGRLEELCGVTLDCAHNPHAMGGLVEWLKTRRAQDPRWEVRCVFGASQDKDIKGVVELLAPHVDVLIWVSAQYPRCAQGVELERAYGPLAEQLNPELVQRVSSSIPHTLEELERTRGARKPTKELDLVTGSCFVVGEARATLLGIPFPEAELRTIAR